MGELHYIVRVKHILFDHELLTSRSDRRWRTNRAVHRRQHRHPVGGTDGERYTIEAPINVVHHCHPLPASITLPMVIPVLPLPLVPIHPFHSGHHLRLFPSSTSSPHACENLTPLPVLLVPLPFTLVHVPVGIRVDALSTRRRRSGRRNGMRCGIVLEACTASEVGATSVPQNVLVLFESYPRNP